MFRHVRRAGEQFVRLFALSLIALIKIERKKLCLVRMIAWRLTSYRTPGQDTDREHTHALMSAVFDQIAVINLGEVGRDSFSGTGVQQVVRYLDCGEVAT